MERVKGPAQEKNKGMDAARWATNRLKKKKKKLLSRQNEG